MPDHQISPDANIGSNNAFGCGVVIGDHVTIGDNNVIENHVVITGNTVIGSGNYVGDQVSIGRVPTHSRQKFELQKTPEPENRFGQILIGDRNVIREVVNIGLPTGDLTSVANDCYISPHCHIPHDTVLEDRVILANHSSPGGHSKILEGAYLGKNVQLHPRIVVGQYTMLGMSAVVLHSVLPAVTAAGSPARFLGVNRIGLERNGFDSDDVESISELLLSLHAREGDAGVDWSKLTPRMTDMVRHFHDVLEEARDRRTLPLADLENLEVRS